MDQLTVNSVEVEAVSGVRPPSRRTNQRQIRAIDVYPEHHASETRPVPTPPWLEALYVHVRCESGIDGFYGPIDRAAAWSIVDTLADFLIGQDALAGNIIWDKMRRLDRHSRHGHMKMAISAIDNALWDARGKAYGAPVWRLLGGASRQQIPAYASTLGSAHDPKSVQTMGRELAAEGYTAQKWFLAYGPSDGWAGMQQNIKLAEELRDLLGPGTDIMFDAWMGWDLAYAHSWAQQVEHLDPRWLEEPFSPSHDMMFAELHRSTRVPLAAGEHIYDRREVLTYLEQGAVTVLQMDPEWCGGVTDLVRMCALAETFGIPIIPHGHGVHAALHVVASQSPETCPMVEYLLHLMPTRHHFELDAPTPRRGVFDLSKAPGFGIELDESKIERRMVWTR